MFFCVEYHTLGPPPLWKIPLFFLTLPLARATSYIMKHNHQSVKSSNSANLFATKMVHAKTLVRFSPEIDLGLLKSQWNNEMKWNDILAIPKRNNTAQAYSTIVVLVSDCPLCFNCWCYFCCCCYYCFYLCGLVGWCKVIFMSHLTTVEVELLLWQLISSPSTTVCM